MVKGSVDGDIFYDFICSLLLKFMPFNGLNKHSVVICDNCSIHHVEEIDVVLSDAQALTHYLLPYSRDFNPIELAFSKVKYMIKAFETEMQIINDIETIVQLAFQTITVEDCENWISG